MAFILQEVRFGDKVKEDEWIDRIMSLFAPRPIDDDAKSRRCVIGFYEIDGRKKDGKLVICCGVCRFDTEEEEWICLRTDNVIDPTHYLQIPEKLEG